MRRGDHARLKYCTARSCFCAAAREENVPRFFRFPVFASFLREYKRYSPDCNLRTMRKRCRIEGMSWQTKKDAFASHGLVTDRSLTPRDHLRGRSAIHVGLIEYGVRSHVRRPGGKHLLFAIHQIAGVKCR